MSARPSWSTSELGGADLAAAWSAGQISGGQSIDTVTVTSSGRCLVYGSGDAVLRIARRLEAHLDVTTCLTSMGDTALFDLPRRILVGRLVSLRGHFGAYRAEIEGSLAHGGTAPAAASGPRQRIGVETDIVLDLSQGGILLAGCGERDGYVRANPADPVSLAAAVLEASHLVGEFEKPRYVAYQRDLCTHSRNGQTGCTRCLDVCPAGAISPEGDGVAFDPHLCEGCGGCASVCPTGAASYSLPSPTALSGQVRAMFASFDPDRARRATLLLYEPAHGDAILEVLARAGRLPDHVVPLAVNSVASIGHDVLIALLLCGPSRVVRLVPPRHRDNPMAMALARELADVILAAHGATNRLVDLGEDDPDAVADALAIDAETPPAWRAPILGTTGTRREISRAILRTLRSVAEVTPDVVQVPGGSPYGEVVLDRDRCTLCLACAGACPTGALIDTADRPALRFVERSCVQCGICVATCPEDALRLSPRLLLTDKAGEPRELASEEPFACRSCGKPFGTRSSIERVKARLHGNSHYADPARLALVELCGDCRVIRLLDQREPLAAKPRPLPRKSEDYLASE